MGRTATVDPRPGGRIRIDYGSGHVMLGEVVELDPPRRLVFTWGWEDPAEAVQAGGSRVEVDLTADGDGTRLRLRHSGLPDGEVDSHAEGWDYFLGRLAAAAGRTRRRPDRAAAAAGASPTGASREGARRGPGASRTTEASASDAPERSPSSARTSSGRPMPFSGS